MPKLKKGDPAPDFSLLDQDGKQVSLSDYKGKNIVLYFYPKDFSPGCTKEACTFRDKYEEFTDLGALVIGISGDSVESHKRFLDKYLLPFTLLSDEASKVRKLYGATRLLGAFPGRYTFVIDRNGVIRYVFSSETNMEKHVQETLRVLKSYTAESSDSNDS